eukprot:scaffold143_cov173-Ochromonas_danica.AAC.20
MNKAITSVRLGPFQRLNWIAKRYLSGTGPRVSNFDWLCNEKITVPGSALELGACYTRMGHLTESSILGKAEGTVVHVALASKSPDETPKEDFLPLTVDYRSRDYSFGKLPDQTKRRERHGTDEEILVARVVDRAVRPLFPKGYVNEVQLTITSHAVEASQDPIVVAVNAASLALAQSQHPWNGPIGCVRVAMVGDQFVVNPSKQQLDASPLDLLYAGTKNRTVMIEAGGCQVPEKVMADAMSFAHTAIQDIVHAQNTFIMNRQKKMLLQEGGGNKVDIVKRGGYELTKEQKDNLLNRFLEDAKQMYRSMKDDKDARGKMEGMFIDQMKGSLSSDPAWSSLPVVLHAMATDYVSHTAFREILLEVPHKTEIRRVDGRSPNQLRPISCMKEVLPTVHGSSYFARGDTHVICTTTLASAEQCRELVPLFGNGEEEKQYFILHYDFPPYCTGETGNSTALNRRMIGHGNLAEKALKYVMPKYEDFPYTTRVFSECVSSNGSSSMAAACGGTLALLDAGVPLIAPVADAQGKYILLKDIIGSEDHNGDMDFKVAGTSEGITAIQLDVKLAGGVPLHMLIEALQVARQGRLELLGYLKEAIKQNPNISLRPQSPRAELVKTDETRVDHLIGPQGKTINFLRKVFNVDIELDEDFKTCYIFGNNAQAVIEAKACIEDIATILKEGTEVTATIVEILDYGILVRVNRGGEGFIHYSDLTYDDSLLKKPLDSWMQMGHAFKAKVLAFDVESGTVRLSRKLMLDPKLPDNLKDIQLPSKDEVVNLILHELPKFPVKPPRPWSLDFFRGNVASASDIAKALKGDNEERKPQQNIKSSNSNKQPHHRNGSSPAATSSTAGNASDRPKDREHRERRGGKDQSRRGPKPVSQTQPQPQQQSPSQPAPQSQPQPPQPESVAS